MKKQCEAVIRHGPGHQSRTKCQVVGKHKVHEAVYGSYEQYAQWVGDKCYSGYFDDPPTPPMEVEDE